MASDSVRGRENPAATQDDGSYLRNTSEQIISNQPQSNSDTNRNHAELPVSAEAWNIRNVSPLRPMHGLDFLIGVSTLHIQQTVDISHLTSNIKSENLYTIKIPNGLTLYLASERSSKTQRLLCGVGRAFTMQIHDNTRQNVMHMERRLAAASCWFPCRLQEMQVITPPGDYIGRVQQQWTWVVPFYLVRNFTDDVLYVIEGPSSIDNRNMILGEFKILSSDSLREVGKISHRWDGQLNSFITAIDFPHCASEPKHKALLLAATFLLVMVNSPLPCKSVDNKREKTWRYNQYYIGERDVDNRKNGHGVNNWTGAKSLESYEGHFTRDTMHGAGEYRWRHHDGVPFTYEGYFFNNNIHGYGVMSYPDGRTFRGLFINNTRWGPGIQSHASINEDVGLWRGPQLIRLAWKPSTPSITPDFMLNAIGKTIVESQRRLLATRIKVIGKSNSAIDLLKEYGADPVSAVEKWHKLYPKHCTDIASELCYVRQFEQDYYRNDTQCKLEEVNQIPYFEDTQTSDNEQNTTYYAWNNNNIIVNMMKHAYQHEEQRDQSQIDLPSVLSGPRRLFKPVGKHEADCRALLLTSFLGYIVNVAQLINKENVHPNLSDVQGNSTIMYATCGDQTDVIRFLVESGADVNAFNDSCCTPLGIALMRYACAINDISANSMVQALIPPPVISNPPMEESKVFEWNIVRDELKQTTTSVIHKSPSKTGRSSSSKKVKSLMSVKDQLAGKRKIDASPVKAPEAGYDSDDSLCDYKKLYNDANREYSFKINDIFVNPNSDVPYLFQITDMIMEIESLEEDPKKVQDKNPKKVLSKVIKDTFKTSKVLIGQSKDRIDYMTVNSLEKLKTDSLSKMKLTILELLSNGAKPMLVRCPQPALVIAISCNSPDLIKHLVQYGADVNEIYPMLHGYSPLDIAVSRHFTWENLEIIRALLESGANASRSIFYEGDSSDITVTVIRNAAPTLLHAVIARKVESENEEEIRRHLIELLLDYNCNPLSQFKGRSAIDVAMTKNINLFDVFVRNRKTNLNCVINDLNQSVLVKMFSNPYFKSIGAERIQTLTNLLVYGADPLLPCNNGLDKYDNIFVFAKKTLSEMENVPQGTQDSKAKKPDKPKKDEKLSIKSTGKMLTDDKEDYKQAIELVKECARLVHIRWLQGQLAKNLIETIYRYRHRQWNMILNECHNKKSIGLWLTPNRGMEIWNIFNSTKNKIYSDQRVLKHFLCIVTFLAWRFYSPKNNDITPWTKVTAIVKDLIEKDVHYILKENKSTNKITEDIPWKCAFARPELDRAEKKYKICFECALPQGKTKITCNVCKSISFCSLECLRENIERANCHPCSSDIKLKYFRSEDVKL